MPCIYSIIDFMSIIHFISRQSAGRHDLLMNSRKSMSLRSVHLYNHCLLQQTCGNTWQHHAIPSEYIKVGIQKDTH